MDRKERWLISDLHARIVGGNFTERDVLGLLILLRPFSHKDFPVFEFANFAAHREKDRGHIRTYLERTKSVLDQLGKISTTLEIKPVFSIEQIGNDLTTVLAKFNLPGLETERLNQVVVCIISLLQDVQIVEKRGAQIGTLVVALFATEISLLGQVTLKTKPVAVVFPALAAANRYITVPESSTPIVPAGVMFARCSENVFSFEQVTAA